MFDKISQNKNLSKYLKNFRLTIWNYISRSHCKSQNFELWWIDQPVNRSLFNYYLSTRCRRGQLRKKKLQIWKMKVCWKKLIRVFFSIIYFPRIWILTVQSVSELMLRNCFLQSPILLYERETPGNHFVKAAYIYYKF